MKLTFYHEPQAQQRPRFTPRAGGRIYDPQSSLKRSLRIEAANQMREKALKSLSDALIEVEMIAYSTPPTSWSQKRLKCVYETEPYKPTKPDVDNVSKLYLDILTGIAYDDDRQIVRLHAEKRYSSEPRVEITLTAIQEPK